MIADKELYRQYVIEYLELIASRKAQLAYQKNVPIADVAAELFCMWFDDLYTPGEDDPSLYNLGVHEEGVREFESCFSSAELVALSEFHAFFKSVAHAIPEGLRLEDLHTNDLWCELMGAAKKALVHFEAD